MSKQGFLYGSLTVVACHRYVDKISIGCQRDKYEVFFAYAVKQVDNLLDTVGAGSDPYDV